MHQQQYCRAVPGCSRGTPGRLAATFPHRRGNGSPPPQGRGLLMCTSPGIHRKHGWLRTKQSQLAQPTSRTAWKATRTHRRARFFQRRTTVTRVRTTPTANQQCSRSQQTTDTLDITSQRVTSMWPGPFSMPIASSTCLAYSATSRSACMHGRGINRGEEGGSCEYVTQVPPKTGETPTGNGTAWEKPTVAGMVQRCSRLVVAVMHKS